MVLGDSFFGFLIEFFCLSDKILKCQNCYYGIVFARSFKNSSEKTHRNYSRMTFLKCCKLEEVCRNREFLLSVDFVCLQLQELKLFCSHLLYRLDCFMCSMYLSSKFDTTLQLSSCGLSMFSSLHFSCCLSRYFGYSSYPRLFKEY